MRSGSLSDDEKRISAEVANLVRLSEKRCEPCFSDFLSDSEQLIAERALRTEGITEYLFWGGYEGAQRAMLCVYPPYSEPEGGDFPMTAVNLKFRRSAKLTHRDFLGSIMALGLKREALGDIVIGEGAATFFVKSELVSYVSGQLEKVGREGVAYTDKGVDFSKITQNFEERNCTVSSPRLDAIVGECTRLSRAKAQQAVKSGIVSVNAQVICDSDRRINDNDKISVRGYGKFIVKLDGSMSKKGKYRLTVLKYL